MLENQLIMERPLALRLLHQAQIADAPVGGLITAGNTLDDYIPGDWRSGCDAAVAQGRRPCAIFAFAPGRAWSPRSEDFEQAPELLRITAWLETKGVLQLRVYRRIDGQVEECPLRIID
jgi:hypothetical protein